MITALSINKGGLGRFANTCFTICGTIGVAMRSKQPFAFPKWVNRDNALFGGNADEMGQYFVNQLPELPEGLQFNEYPYHWYYKDIWLPTGNWNMFNHFQSFKYFEHCRETILHYFRMKDEPPQNDFTMIHMRCGDYTEGINGYHPRMSAEYYEQAIRQFPVNTNFLIFTDDYEYFKNNIALNLSDYVKGNYVFKRSEGSSYIEDFRLMKRCKSFIIANSSFSAMAAWLGEHPEKKVVSPSWDNWFGKAADINAKDLIHKDWIQIKTW